jgi:phosphopantothenoylcysteine decarboxylase/phosphopantothenate--cysteine ligase
MRIALGVCGGIAAYKAAELVRVFQQDAFAVEVVMTAGAQQFVRPLTFAALSGNKVITGMWSGEASDDAASPNLEAAIEHIAVAQRITALVVAPATADMLAKFANGIADDFLSTLYLATKAPVMVAPAMNVNMWEHAATQHNLSVLRARGVHVVEPGEGYLACGMTGSGRMAEPAAIAQAVRDMLLQPHDLEAETVLVTAGGTREPLDPVRFIGNRSSGKMGFAIAENAARRGARVILVAAPNNLATPAGCERVDVVTSAEMREAVLQRLPEATIVVKAAAVSDFRPAHASPTKMKRDRAMRLDLQPTEDILAEVCQRKRPGTFVLGFAAETENAIENARAKMLRKGVDAIVVNDVSQPGVGFDSDDNAATLLTAEETFVFSRTSKRQLATKLLDQLVRLRVASQDFAAAPLAR